MSKRRDCPFQLTRKKLPGIDGHVFYVWRLIDVTTDYPIASGTSTNPFNAPQSLRRIQASLNSRYVLDKLRIC